ncbi:hypothetical protein ACFRJ9_21755 [Paenarthrobacter sp. NPDC056912]|uniref:hypothetical protein n=1 Tax=Paenarthrobacter sp. NPDC056912 TaxID=3345965 RepID=UPI0036704008
MKNDSTMIEHSGQASDGGHDRFLRQSRILSQLQHELTEPVPEDQKANTEPDTLETQEQEVPLASSAKPASAKVLWLVVAGVVAAAALAIGVVVTSTPSEPAPVAPAVASSSSPSSTSASTPRQTVSPRTKPLPSMVNKVPPSITGAAAGKVVSVDFGSWDPMPTTANIQWFVDGAPVEGANQRSFTLRAGDKGKEVHVRIKVKRSGFEPVEISSARVKVP